MGRLERLCVAASMGLLIFVLLQSTASAYVEAMQAGAQSERSTATWQLTVAQSDIPEVLTPSLEPLAEPSIYIPTETPSVTPTQAHTTNVTTPLTEQNSISLEKLVSGIPSLTVVLLVPLLIVIAVLFYTLLRAEQDAEFSPEEADNETEPAHVVRRSLRGRYGKKRHIKR